MNQENPVKIKILLQTKSIKNHSTNFRQTNQDEGPEIKSAA